ncbi:hypothetical protein ACLVWU_15230 [Bdellovibrio sp. HCB290]|uniref:hypothetical protein n=1 Tax=Bdellovibrio sp. HCB290 TaxID=3394356 RepID=UPI0039B4CEC8
MLIAGTYLVSPANMRFLVSLTILLFGASAFAGTDSASEKRVVFNPVVSTSARTLPQWQFGYQRTGGANVNSHMLMNAVSVGILPRLEIGTVPMFYATASGSSNYTVKVNFYRGDQVDWAASFTETRFKSEARTSGGVVDRPELVLRSIQLGLNYRPEWNENTTFSPFANQVCGHIESKDALVFLYSLKCEAEYGLDVQYQIKDREWLTLAYGHLREAGLSPYERLNAGVGVAWSQLRPKAMFSRPSVGVYYIPDTQNTLYLLSTTFFEH